MGSLSVPSPGTPSTLTIDGSPVSIPRDLIPIRLVPVAKGSYPTLTFAVRGKPLPTSGVGPYLGKEAVLTVDGTVRFKGDVVFQGPQFQGSGGLIVRTYQCHGLEARANRFAHTDSITGVDSSAYNLALDNQQSDYLAARAGRTVGEILEDVLTMDANAANLDAAGIGAYTSLSPPTLPASTAADLAAITLIPPAPVYFGGEKLWEAIVAFLGQWAPNHWCYVDPVTGAIRVVDCRTFSDRTLTFGTDPVRPTGISRDLDPCFGRVVALGEPIAEMGVFSTAAGTLSESPFAHDGLTIAQAKAAWTPTDDAAPGMAPGQAIGVAVISGGAVNSGSLAAQGYGYTSTPSVSVVGDGTGASYTATRTGDKITALNKVSGGTGYTKATFVIDAPGGACADAGTCSCTSTTTVDLTSENPATTWPSNYWDQTAGNKAGVILLNYAAGTGVSTTAMRRIVANASHAPGSTSSVTLDLALPHTNFDSYTLCGYANTSSAVWKEYALPSGVGAKLARQSTYPFPYRNANGVGITMTSTPMGAVRYSSNNLPPFNEAVVAISVNPDAGTIRFAQATYTTAGNRAPDDVRVIVPIYTDVNKAVYPADVGGVPQFAGTAAAAGWEKTLTVVCRSWRDPGNLAAMQAYAEDLLDSVKDIVMEGTITYLGLYEDALTPGIRVSVAGNGYTTGWESAELPVVQSELLWNADGVSLPTVLKCSNRRAHYSAEAFLHPDRAGLTPLFGGEVSVPAAGMPFGDFGGYGAEGAAVAAGAFAAGNAVGASTAAMGADQLARVAGLRDDPTQSYGGD